MRMPERISMHRNLAAIGNENRHHAKSKFDKTNPIPGNLMPPLLVQRILCMVRRGGSLSAMVIWYTGTYTNHEKPAGHTPARRGQDLPERKRPPDEKHPAER